MDAVPHASAEPTPLTRVVGATTASAEALDALRSLRANPVMRCFPQGALIVFDSDLRYLAAGGQSLAEVGLSAEMLEGKTIFEVFPPETIAVIEPLYRRALAGLESSFDVPFLDRIFVQRLGPLRDAAGEIVAGMGFTQDVTEARRSEEALRESENRFRLAFDHAPIGKALISPTGRFLEVNRAFCALTGYGEEELLTKDVSDITHPDDLPTERAADASLLAGDVTTVTFQKRYLTSTGTTVWAEKSASLVRRADGSPLHFIAQIQDITERQADEARLSEQNRRLQDAESIGQTGSWEFDATSDTITWSDGLFALYGIDRASFGGDFAAAVECIHPDDREAVKAATETSLRLREPMNLNYRVIRPSDGSLRWFEARGGPVYDGDHLMRLAGALTDVTDRMTVEAALLESQELFRQLVDNIDVAFLLRSWEPPQFLYVSPAYVKIFGYNPMTTEETPQESLRRIHPDDLERFLSEYWTRSQAGLPATVDYRIRRSDGQERWVRARSAPVADADGSLRRSATIVDDITDSKRAEAALWSAREGEKVALLAARDAALATTVRQNHFAASASHELRTPTTSILGFIEDVLDNNSLADDDRTSLNVAYRNARRLSTLIDDLLIVGEADTGSAMGRLELTPLMPVVESVVASLAAVAHRAGVQFETFDDGAAVGRGCEPLSALADPVRLEQALTNLIGNAVKFTRPGGRVTVGVKAAGKSVEVVVKDTGIGIDAATIDHIFDRFFRAQSAVDVGIKGSGLGLPIAQQMIQAQNGRISVSSVVGQGSTFTVSLSAATAALDEAPH